MIKRNIDSMAINAKGSGVSSVQSMNKNCWSHGILPIVMSQKSEEKMEKNAAQFS